MTRASQVAATNHTAGQLRRAAQQWCASMTRDHRNDIERYRFTDGSAILINRSRCTITTAIN